MLGGIGSSSAWSKLRYDNPLNQGSKMQDQTAAYANPSIAALSQPGSSGKVDAGECQTCKERKYQDGSNDIGVSMKTATTLSPGEASARVSAHEKEHVVREQAKARAEGREVVSQTVHIKTAVCPECGRVYVSGGETRTVTKGQSRSVDSPTGNLFDAYA